jgi:hypothetical protein
MRKKEKRKKCGHFEKWIALFLKRPFEQAFHFFWKCPPNCGGKNYT